MDPLAIFIATFPFVWLSIIYFFDYKFDYTEKSFFKRPLEKAVSQLDMIRELCLCNLSERQCPLFRNLSSCLEKGDYSVICSYEPWFKPENILDPKELARKLLDATEQDKLEYFLKQSITSTKMEMLKNIFSAVDPDLKMLKELLAEILNESIRDLFIYEEERFNDVELDDPDIEILAASKVSKPKEKFKHLQLNSFLLEKAFPNCLETRLYVNRIWKLIRDCHICSLQSNFLEFTALEALIIYLNEYHANKVTEWLNITIILFIIFVLIIWGITLSQGEPYPLFKNKRNRLCGAIGIWGITTLILIFV